MRLALLAEAEAELDDAATWYDDRSEGLGDEFMDVALTKPSLGHSLCLLSSTNDGGLCIGLDAPNEPTESGGSLTNPVKALGDVRRDAPGAASPNTSPAAPAASGAAGGPFMS